jgi:cell division septation protein DedD
VSEFTHDTADEGFHEIQLSGKQLVFLFIVTTTVIVVVFLCGVKVGRGARAAQGDDSDPITTSSAASPTQAAPVPDPEPPAAEPPAPAPEEPPLSYPERLAGGSNASEKLKPQPDPAPAPAAKAEAPRPAPPPSEDRAASPAATSGVPAAGRPGTWVVQVIATRDRNMAASIVKRLTGKSYPAFLVNPAAGPGPAYYKVQVGRYNDRGEAEQVSARIKKEEQFQSWITR